MHIVEIAPVPCIVCGMGNTPNNDRSRRQFVDLEIDVNWNEPGIICEDCGLKIGGLLGMLSGDARTEMMAQVRKAQEELHDKEAEMDTMKRRAKRLGVVFEKELVA